MIVTDNPRVSVIVPIYNVEKYLERCLNSVKKQTFTDFEVIMINDGSTDKSSEIAQRFAESDSRFILINQENKGISEVRNKGVQLAGGEYICFVDSDDFCTEDYIEKLYNAAKKNNADISCCVYSFYYEKTGKSRIVRLKNLKSGIYSGQEAAYLVTRDDRLRAYLWHKMWKKDLFIKNNITFPPMDCFEDTIVAHKLMYFANKCVAIDDCCYYYVVRENSVLTSSMTFKTLNEYLITMEILRNFFEENNVYHLYRRALKHYGLFKKILSFNMLRDAHKNVGSNKGFLRNYITIIKYVNYTVSKKYLLSKYDGVYRDIVKKFN